MSLIGFLIANLFVGSVLQEKQNTQEENKKLRDQLREMEDEK